jgi:hypothetical protein
MAAGIEHQIVSFDVNATTMMGCLRRSHQIFVEMVSQQ